MPDVPSSLSEIISRRIEEHVNQFFETAPCGCVITSPQGELVKINKTLLTWLGYAEDDLPTAKSLADLINKGGRIYFETHILPLLSMQDSVKGIALKFLRKDGTEFPVLIAANRHLGKENVPIFHSIIVTDFSHRKHYEEGLVAAKKVAEQNDEAKSLFLSTISHEVLTPLNAILGTAELLAITDLNDQQSHLQSILVGSGKHLLELFKNILVVSKSGIDELKPMEKPFRPEDLITSIVDSFRYGTQLRDFTFSLAVDAAVPEVLIGDPTLLNQLLTNLLSNAAKFTREGSVTTGIRLLGKVDEGRCRVRFFVRDTGVGIDKQHLPRLVQPFTQASRHIHSQYGGSGLGLTICNSILKEYDSQVEVESTKGEGATFWFDLELAIGTPEDSELTKNNHLPPIGMGNVLIVEDNQTNSFLVSRYFRKWKVSFDLAANGREALELMQENRYDVILMDMKMPVMDGYTASRKIRELPTDQRNVPIIAFSASASLAITDRMREAQIDEFALKPFSPRHLYNLVEKFLKPKTMNYMELREAMDNDPDDLRKFSAVLQRELTMVADELAVALSHDDGEKVGDLKHKLKTSLQLLEAESIRNDLMTITEDLRNVREVTRSRKTLVVEKLRQLVRELSRERW